MSGPISAISKRGERHETHLDPAHRCGRAVRCAAGRLHGRRPGSRQHGFCRPPDRAGAAIPGPASGGSGHRQRPRAHHPVGHRAAPLWVLEAAARADTAPQPVPGLSLRWSAMPTVGPVTLGQDLFWRLLSGQQVLPIQRGCDLYTRNFLDYWNLRAVDALETGRNAFTTGNTDWASPLWCTNGQSVAKVLGSLSLSVRAVRGPCGIRRQHAGRGHPRRTHCPGPAASADRRPPAGCGRCRRSSGGSTVPIRQHHPLCLRYRHRHLRDAAP